MKISALQQMASEKRTVSNFTAAKVGLLLLAGCILAPISLVAMLFRHDAVPMQTLRLLFSVPSSATSVMWEEEKMGSLLCDMSSARSDVCELRGHVRVVLSNATVVLLDPSVRHHRSWRMKPHARKKDRHALAGVTEVTVSVLPAAETEHASPGCTARNAAPAVVFSVGGYAGNMFHDFTDVLVPLFITARRFHGNVHLLVSDAPSWWLDKYRPLLRGLSRHAVVDMNRERAGVLCYPHAVVGLTFHKEMSVDAAKTAGGYSMADFARLARRSYGLERDTTIRLRHDVHDGDGDGDNNAGVRRLPRPRLLIISRKATRTFTNIDGVARTAAALGYEVVVGEPVQHADLGAFAALVNSCDVLVGVHGAGLANLVFLPAGAVVVQVVPLGGLDAAAREAFGAPAGDMGLGYVQYSVAAEESSLARRYHRDHRVLRDPAAVRREGGWLALRSVYLVGQNVTVDVARFSGALRRAMELLHQQLDTAL